MRSERALQGESQRSTGKDRGRMSVISLSTESCGTRQLCRAGGQEDAETGWGSLKGEGATASKVPRSTEAEV